ncbi:MAG: bifunctional nicotinamidase/pyrazinamidase [Pirellulaceae bacterium]
MRKPSFLTHRTAGPMNALILVDLQNDFLPGGSLAVPHGDEVVPIANHLQHSFDLVVASRDWHPPNHGSFADNHESRVPGDCVALDGLSQVLWPRHCVQGTDGARFAPDLDVRAIVRVFHKGTDSRVDSYSAFFDNGHRQATGLGDYLRLQGVTDVYLMGLATDYCVKFSSLDAHQLGFHCHVVEDGCRGVELRPGDIQSAFEEMRQAGVSITTSDAVIERVAERTGSVQMVASTKFLQVLRRGRWEYVRRHCGPDVVVMMAVTEDDCVLLVEQYRPPVDARVVELPAGLVGHDAEAGESSTEAARRELREETGYDARHVREVFAGPTSAGLTDEMVSFLVAKGLTRVSEGGGVGGEQIEVHKIPLTQLPDWLEQKKQQGCLIDARLFTGIYWLMRDGDHPRSPD